MRAPPASRRPARSLPLLALALLALGPACADDEALIALNVELSGPGTLELGAIIADTERVASFEIENRGTGAAAPLLITVEGDGFELASGPLRLDAQAHATVEVRFSAIGRPLGGAAGRVRLASGLDEERVELAATVVPAPSCDDDNPCTDDRFDAATGACGHAERTGSCDDGSACTQLDRCVVGVCLGEVVACDDGVRCTVDACDPEVGCRAIPEHTACDDDDPCTVDSCDAQGCESVPAADFTPCGAYEACQTAEVCFAQVCTLIDIPDGAPCGSNDICAPIGTCDAGVCATEPIEVSALGMAAEQLEVGGAYEAALVGGDRAVTIAWFVSRHGAQVLDLGSDAVRARQSLGAPALRVAPFGGERALFWQATSTPRLELWSVDSASGAVTVELMVDEESELPQGMAWPGGGAVRPAAGPDRVVFCAPTASTGCAMTALTLREGALDADFLGQAYLDQRYSHALSGELWVQLDRGEGNQVPSFRLYKIGEHSSTLVLDHGWNPSGVSSYGRPVAALVSDDFLLVDLEHQSRFFAVHMDDDGVTTMEVVQLPALAGAELFAMVGRTVYFVLGDQIRAATFEDPAAPVTHDVVWPRPEGYAAVSVLAADDRWLLLSGGVALPSLEQALDGAPPALVVTDGPGPLHTVRTDGATLYSASSGAVRPVSLTLTNDGTPLLLPLSSATSRPAGTILLDGPLGPAGLLDDHDTRAGRLGMPSYQAFSVYEVRALDDDTPGLLFDEAGHAAVMESPLGVELHNAVAEGCLIVGGASPAWDAVRLVDRCTGAEGEILVEAFHALFLDDGHLLLGQVAAESEVWRIGDVTAPQLLATVQIGPDNHFVKDLRFEGSDIVSLTAPAGVAPPVLERRRWTDEGYALTASLPLDEDGPSVSLLGVDSGLVWLSVLDDDDGQPRVDVYRLHDGAELVASMPTPLPVQDLTWVDGVPVGAREDGLVVFDPPCGP